MRRCIFPPRSCDDYPPPQSSYVLSIFAFAMGMAAGMAVSHKDAPKPPPAPRVWIQNQTTPAPGEPEGRNPQHAH